MLGAAPRLLEELRVLQRDRRVVGQRRHELDLAHGEIVRLEEVHDEDAVRLLAGGDGRPQVRARSGGVDQPLGRRRVMHRRVVAAVTRPHRLALQVGAPGDSLAGAQREGARQRGGEIEAAMEDQRSARGVEEEHADGVAPGQLLRLLGDEIEQVLSVEAGGELTRHRVELRRLLLAAASLGVEPALLERHREILTERAERLDALRADGSAARLVVGARRADHPLADDQRRHDEPPRAQVGLGELRVTERQHRRQVRVG